MKNGWNSSRWTKFDPLPINIFWIYNFSSLDIIKFVTPRSKKSHLIFSTISILQPKIWKFCQNMGSLCWVPLIYITNCFYFVTVISTLLDTASCVFFVINSSAVALFTLGDSFNYFNSLTKHLRHSLCM